MQNETEPKKNAQTNIQNQPTQNKQNKKADQKKKKIMG